MRHSARRSQRTGFRLPIVLDRERLGALAQSVGEFHITDKRMRAAQDRFAAALAGNRADDDEVRAYLRAVTSYFAAFSSEAQAHLRRVDRELEALYQRQYNLNAERAVAARRIEATQGVLTAIANLGAR